MMNTAYTSRYLMFCINFTQKKKEKKEEFRELRSNTHSLHTYKLIEPYLCFQFVFNLKVVLIMVLNLALRAHAPHRLSMYRLKHYFPFFFSHFSSATGLEVGGFVMTRPYNSTGNYNYLNILK